MISLLQRRQGCFAGIVSRGDVVLMPIGFVSGTGSKVRPAVVIQNDTVDQRDIVRVIGRVSQTMLIQLEVCLKAALEIA